jgi:hypothetical protein
LFGNFAGGIGLSVPALAGFVLGLLRDNVVIIPSSLLFLTLGIYWLSSGWSKLQLRENGILDFTGLLSWQHMAGYSWEGKDGNLLVIHIKQPPRWLQSFPLAQSLLSQSIYLFWASRLRVPISPPQKETVTKLLDQHLARTTPISE